MRLLRAARLEVTRKTALVGAGGKSAALFQLGREFLAGPDSPIPFENLPAAPRRVLLSATAHLSVEQLGFADQVRILPPGGEVPSLPDAGLILCVGPQIEPERQAGLEPAALDALVSAWGEAAPVLIEADGSRQRPLKAPADHEPPIPPWVDTVIVSAGLSGLGKPLSEEWVHRPERFGALADLAPGQEIAPEHLRRVLCHPAGGLKGIPDASRRVALLNQAGDARLQAAALRLSRDLLEAYQAVVVADLPPARPGSAFPQPDPVIAVHEKIAGVILAAGASRRFGRPKQLLEWQGLPLVRRSAQTALQAGLSPVVAVLGDSAAQVEAALSGLPVRVVFNPDWEAGQSASIAAGVRALPPETGAAVFLLADQPHLPAGLLRGLADLHATEQAPIIAPLVDGRRGNPVLFDRRLFEALSGLSGDMGGRALFSRVPPRWLPWHDPQVLLDIDTPEDYARLIQADPGGPLE